MLTRLIAKTNEPLPAIGIGSWQQFDVGNTPDDRVPLLNVLRQMHQHGGKVIDSSPMYARSEEVIGDLTDTTGLADQFFYATKVWTTGKQAGIDQMEDSFRKMRRQVMDLMQIHNLVDWKTHLATLADWKADGRVRYIGITHYVSSAHARLEQIIRSEDAVEFAQFNYSIRVRDAENSLLPACMDRGVAVVVNEPFEKGSLFALVKGQELPEWAAEYDIHTWAQFFLKYIVSHPAVTCVIPGTSDVVHLLDNMSAGMGQMPDAAGRKKMVQFIERL